MQNTVLYFPLLLAVIGLIVMYVQSVWVRKQSVGDDKMKSISESIKEGALAFLSAEYRLLLIFVVIASVALFGISTIVDTTSWLIVPAFVVGAVFQEQVAGLLCAVIYYYVEFLFAVGGLDVSSYYLFHYSLFI